MCVHCHENKTANSNFGVEYYVDKVETVLDDFRNSGVLYYDDIQHTYTGIRANVEAWYNRKSHLFDLLRKHPNWNEEAKAVVFNYTETRKADMREFCKSVCILEDEFCERIEALNPGYLSEPGFLSECEKNDGLHPRFLNECEKKRYYLSRYIWIQYSIFRLFDWVCQEIRSLETPNVISAEIAEEVNTVIPEIKAKKGMKSSRLINKLCVELGIAETPNYNRIFAKLADSINPLEIKKTSVLSVNFLDFLLMSNGNSWSSCHTILNNSGDNYSGCYKGGTLSYANDDVTMIFYTVDSRYDGTDWCLEKKLNRQVFFWEYPVLVQERLYPQCNDNTEEGTELTKQYRKIVESIISICLDKPNLWILESRKEAAEVEANKDEDVFMYHDWECFPNWIAHIKDETPTSDYQIGKDKTITVGGESYCMACGHQKDEIDYYDDEGKKTLLCWGCCNFHYCSGCDNEYDIDDLREIDGNFYCQDCCFYCDYHERWETGNSYCYVENYGEICQDAFDSGDFMCCDCCGEIILCDHAIDYDCEWLCCDCYIENRHVCGYCGDYIDAEEIDDAKYINGLWYHGRCFEELEDEESEDEELEDEESEDEESEDEESEDEESA